MKLFHLLSVLPAFLATSTHSIPATAGPDPNGVYVESISYGGTGCPQGSVSTSFSPDRTTFTLIFDSFVAQVGPTIAVKEARKNCQINTNFHVPAGWQYSVMSADYRGYVSLDAGVKASQKTIYYFQGEVAQVSSGANFAGPTDQDYVVHDQVPFNTKITSLCNNARPINANTDVRIDKTANPNGRGQMSTDSLDGRVTYKLNLLWQRC